MERKELERASAAVKKTGNCLLSRTPAPYIARHHAVARQRFFLYRTAGYLHGTSKKN
jgi:hypothetical protein